MAGLTSGEGIILDFVLIILSFLIASKARKKKQFAILTLPFVYFAIGSSLYLIYAVWSGYNSYTMLYGADPLFLFYIAGSSLTLGYVVMADKLLKPKKQFRTLLYLAPAFYIAYYIYQVSVIEVTQPFIISLIFTLVDYLFNALNYTLFIGVIILSTIAVMRSKFSLWIVFGWVTYLVAAVIDIAATISTNAFVLPGNSSYLYLLGSVSILIGLYQKR